MSEYQKFKALVAKAVVARRNASDQYVAAVQEIVNKRKAHLATGHASDMWQVSLDGKNEWKDDMDEPKHPIFDDLERLDGVARELNIGPSNLERYSPNNAK